MAIDPKNASHIQIGITLMESFLDALPEYFRVGNDQKLHHDPHDVNVFAHKKLTGKHMFADSYGEELKFNSVDEFLSLQRKLLAKPIYLHVRLEKEKKSGNTRFITKGDFVVFINTEHPVIQQQLSESLNEVHRVLCEGKKVALEIKVGSVLKRWFKASFPESSGSYSAEEGNFCITNYSQRYHDCYNPLVWLVCLPCCLVCGPIYCIQRKLKCVDIECNIFADVKYIEGISVEDRRELMMMLAGAYASGMNAGSNMIANQYSDSSPSYPPPPYTAVRGQSVPI